MDYLKMIKKRISLQLPKDLEHSISMQKGLGESLSECIRRLTVQGMKYNKLKNRKKTKKHIL